MKHFFNCTQSIQKEFIIYCIYMYQTLIRSYVVKFREFTNTKRIDVWFLEKNIARGELLGTLPVSFFKQRVAP